MLKYGIYSSVQTALVTRTRRGLLVIDLIYSN